MHLADGVPRVFWQTANAMRDVQFVFTHHGSARVAQQFVVVQQATGNGILDGCHANDCRVALDVLKHLLKSGTADELQLVAFEILPGRNVVKRPQESLYCNSFHTCCFFFVSAPH